MIRRQKFLDEPQVQRLLDATAGGGRFAARDRAILHLLYATGLRVGELIKIDAEALDLEHLRVQVLGKGRRRRTVLFGERAKQALLAHLGPRRIGPLFRNAEGKRMRARLVRRIVDKYADKADLPKISPHSLRHSCASHLLAHGAYLFAVKELLGHVLLGTTALYLHAVDLGVPLDDVYRAAHPHA